MRNDKSDPILPSEVWNRSATATGYVTTHGSGWRMIDLEAVAAKIAALDGWEVDLGDEYPFRKEFWIGASYGPDDVAIWNDGDVLPGSWDGPMNLLLPVLQIVEAARQEAGGE